MVDDEVLVAAVFVPLLIPVIDLIAGAFELSSSVLIENHSSLNDPVEFPRSPVGVKVPDATI